uniref:DUF1232 domain-containing protein n=1 Tax=Odontella aurita TaxID=265563 RepID=A0A6U6FFW6_9STRA|mmetsp:Transcript_34296/g.102778  ORF Transcript_34296/g.102778 Transcript_34296/m.102778 type:complete len:115 (+) Transcript_34296:123-467(+)
MHSTIVDSARDMANKIGPDVFLLCEMVQMHYQGIRYLNWVDVVCIMWCLAYIVSPLDLFPDCIPLVGFLDDIAVLGMTVNRLQGSIADYKEWRDNNWQGDSLGNAGERQKSKAT